MTAVAASRARERNRKQRRRAREKRQRTEAENGGRWSSGTRLEERAGAEDKPRGRTAAARRRRRERVRCERGVRVEAELDDADLAPDSYFS